jgi:Zn-dependent protease with chaperone function
MIPASITAIAAWAMMAAAGPRLSRRLPPATATRLLVSGCLVVAASGLLVGGLLAATLLARLPEVIEIGPWSSAALRARTPVPVAVAAVAASAVFASLAYTGTVLAGRLLSVWRTRRACAGLAHADGLIVINDDRADAFSTPPPDGRIVVTAGLLRGLNAAERRALLAHEGSHLARGHSWWVVAADLAAAANPMLRPTARAVQQAVERWADEDAAAEVGDRTLVAHTLARSALLVQAARPVTPTLAAATTGVPERVTALLAPAPRRRPVTVALIVALLLASSGAALMVQRDADEFFDRAQIPAAGQR